MLQRCPEIDGGFLYIAKYLGLPFASFGWCVRGESSAIHCDLIHVLYPISVMDHLSCNVCPPFFLSTPIYHAKRGAHLAGSV